MDNIWKSYCAQLVLSHPLGGYYPDYPGWISLATHPYPGTVWIFPSILPHPFLHNFAPSLSSSQFAASRRSRLIQCVQSVDLVDDGKVGFGIVGDLIMVWLCSIFSFRRFERP